MHIKTSVPIIAIDGPSGSGKGTVAAQVATRLGWYYLDSGSLYRLTALAASVQNIGFEEEDKVANIAKNLDVRFEGQSILLAGEEVTEKIRTEAVGEGASVVSKLPSVRQALLQRQRDFAFGLGLVADGRDMGSEVFPEAGLKVYLTASVAERANRRYKQLLSKGMNPDYNDIFDGIAKRDERDMNRSLAPLIQTHDARLLDTTNCSVEEAVQKVLDWWKEVNIRA
ncbi:MAG: (d)CMP kinase [Candidatus Gracilibacteria bacterium]|nr:(d)CMP kinase [Candidatus Gracilibacteria bacterium]